MSFFEGEIHVIKPEIMDDIETLVEFVRRKNVNEIEVTEAVNRIEAYLATYKEHDV